MLDFIDLIDRPQSTLGPGVTLETEIKQKPIYMIVLCTLCIFPCHYFVDEWLTSALSIYIISVGQLLEVIHWLQLTTASLTFF